jgi:hypothetical protein
MSTEIIKAVSAHVMWSAKLKTAIHSGDSSYSLPEIEANDRCELGKWLKSQISPELKNSPHYTRALELHNQFHRVAGKIFGLAINGKSTEALKAIEANGDFAKASASLVSELRAWNKAMGPDEAQTGHRPTHKE